MSLRINKVVYYDDENSYISNDLLEKRARIALTPTDHNIIDVLVRYAYNTDYGQPSLSVDFIAEKTQREQKEIQDSVENLITRKILTPPDEADQQSFLRINENFNEWHSEPKRQKKTNKKNLEYEMNNIYYKMAEHFLDLVTPVAEEAGVSHLIAKANLQSWADEFRKLWEKDKVQDKQQILAVMKWVT